MTPEGWLPIKLLGTFNRLKCLTNDLTILTEVLKFSPELEINGGYVRKRHDWQRWVFPVSPPSSPKTAVTELNTTRSSTPEATGVEATLETGSATAPSATAASLQDPAQLSPQETTSKPAKAWLEAASKPKVSVAPPPVTQHVVTKPVKIPPPVVTQRSASTALPAAAQSRVMVAPLSDGWEMASSHTSRRQRWRANGGGPSPVSVLRPDDGDVRDARGDVSQKEVSLKKLHNLPGSPMLAALRNSVCDDNSEQTTLMEDWSSSADSVAEPVPPSEANSARAKANTCTKSPVSASRKRNVAKPVLSANRSKQAEKATERVGRPRVIKELSGASLVAESSSLTTPELELLCNSRVALALKGAQQWVCARYAEVLQQTPQPRRTVHLKAGGVGQQIVLILLALLAFSLAPRSSTSVVEWGVMHSAELLGCATLIFYFNDLSAHAHHLLTPAASEGSRSA